MDRILVLMAAAEYADAHGALESARSAAAAPEALSWGLLMESEPDDEALQAMNALGMVQFICPAQDPWASMPLLWQGEGYVLLAHPAMRFTKGWDRELLRELRDCPRGQVLKNVLTGFLPVREDPMGAVCPVAADAFTDDGALTFHHGTPLRFAAAPERGMFLHPDFCFGPAGFFRAVAQGDEPLFMRAFRAEWDVYTLQRPLIQLLWDLPVAPAQLRADNDLLEAFSDVFGVSFAGRVLSSPARRGMLSEGVDIRLNVPLPVKARELVRKLQQTGSKLTPLCVTAITTFDDEEAMRWLKQLAGLKNLPLLTYAESPLLRQIAEFHPNVMEYKQRYQMELPTDAPEAVCRLSKPAVLAAARDKYLTHSHYIWLDPDCVHYPIYDKAVFSWSEVCGDRILIAMVNGEPDSAMFCVPDHLVLKLARDMEARALAILRQRGSLPDEKELWSLVIHENPDWFQVEPMPVRRQLFTLLTTNH